MSLYLLRELKKLFLFLWCRAEHLTGQLGSPSDRVLTKYNSPTPKRQTHCNLPDNNGFAKEHRLLGRQVHVRCKWRLLEKNKTLGCDWQSYCSLEPGLGFLKTQSKAFYDSIASRIRRSCALLFWDVLTKSVLHRAQNMKESAWYSSH